MKPSVIFSFILFLKIITYFRTPTNKLSLHLILIFYKMLIDYEFDESGI